MKRMLCFGILLLLVMGTVSVSAETELILWDYVPWRVEFYRQYAEQYMAEHNHITIDVQLVPEYEFRDKVAVSMISGVAPSMFSGHPNWVGDFAGHVAPYPHDLFPPEQLTKELLGYDQLLQEGFAYYYPLGMQGALLFINEDLWDQAGIAEAPVTWSEAINIGRRTTKRSDGSTEVAGFFFNHGNEMMHDLFVDLLYQHGGSVYKDGGTAVAIADSAGRDALNFVVDMYSSGISGFNESLRFWENQQIMLYSFAWRQQQIAIHDHVRWRAEPLPTVDGSRERIGRMQYYFGMAVPKNNPEEEVRAAFQFLNWVYSSEERLMELNSRSGTLPARMSLWGNPEIVNNPVLHTLTRTLPYAVTPGEFPQWMMTMLGEVRTTIVSGNDNPVAKLDDVVRRINARLVEEPISWVAPEW